MEEATSQSSSSGRRRDGASKVTRQNAGTNGDVSVDAEHIREKDAATDATEDMKKASIEDKENQAVEV